METPYRHDAGVFIDDSKKTSIHLQTFIEYL